MAAGGFSNLTPAVLNQLETKQQQMKKLTLTLCALTALVSAAYAGTETRDSKTMVTQPPPCPTWYADSEWTITISGIYAPTVVDYRDDRYLGVDHSWGGAIDAKYFFHRYFGVGLQGFGLGLDRHSRFDRFARFENDGNDFAGGFLGTFTFRYPIPCSRFAPYAWAGVGGIWGGGLDRRLVFDDNGDFVEVDQNNSNGRIMGQYGVGFEVRFSPHFGWTNDVSYNQLEGGDNDFIQVRTGLNFAF